MVNNFVLRGDVLTGVRSVLDRPRHRVESDRPSVFPAYHNQQGRAPSSPPPRPCIGAGDACLVVLKGWEIGRTTTSRQAAGAGTPRDFRLSCRIAKIRLPSKKPPRKRSAPN